MSAIYLYLDEGPAPPPVASMGIAGLTQGTGELRPIQLLVGPATTGAAPGRDITLRVALDTIRVEETGDHESATMSFEVLDKDLAFAALRGEWRVLFRDGGEPLFRGFMRRVSTQVEAIHGGISVECDDVGQVLDSCIITASGVSRKAGESDKARIQWLFGAGWAEALIAEGLGSDWSKVRTLRSSMPRQSFPARLTLRQALERILGAASDSSGYYVDMAGRLHTFDDDHKESEQVAPYEVNVAHAPAEDEVAPEDFEHAWDSSKRRSGLYVQGANAAGSGYVSERSLGMAGPYGADLYGRRDGYASAPDADTRSKRDTYAKAVLRDVRNPVPSGSFSVSGSSVENASGQTWHAGQLLYVTSPMHGLAGAGTDAGPWAGSDAAGAALQPFRIVRVTTTYLNGLGDRRKVIEYGSRRRGAGAG